MFLWFSSINNLLGWFSIKVRSKEIDVKETCCQGFHCSLVILTWFRQWSNDVGTCMHVPFEWRFMHLLAFFFCLCDVDTQSNDNELCQWSDKDIIKKTCRRNIIVNSIYQVVRDMRLARNDPVDVFVIKNTDAREEERDMSKVIVIIDDYKEETKKKKKFCQHSWLRRCCVL